MKAPLILVANAGSSSYKYALYRRGRMVVSAHFETHGRSFRYSLQGAGISVEAQCSVEEFRNSPKLLLELLQKHAVLQHPQELSAIGFRVVHGGDAFSESTVITPQVLRTIKRCIALAPLHNQIAYDHILQWKKLLKGPLFVAVFDTAFHRTIPEHIAAPALPQKLRHTYHLHKFGFHGISCQSILDILRKDLGHLPHRLIICHLGSGSSITAVLHGKSFDTSMGFTPLTGLPMSTRAGDIGGDIILHLQERFHFSPKKLEHLLNKQSGLLGLSGLSADMRVLREARAKGHHGATLAIASFVHHVVQYIGGYITTLGGIDGLVFTAGIGEGSHELRAEICEGLSYHGIQLHKRANMQTERCISTTKSKAAVYVLPTDELGYIAKSTARLLS